MSFHEKGFIDLEDPGYVELNGFFEGLWVGFTERQSRGVGHSGTLNPRCFTCTGALDHIRTGWWFQTFCISSWGDDPI